jgi:predicted 2-oxoglutarate/Fe(II)-dependent dioxygenase YbiX
MNYKNKLEDYIKIYNCFLDKKFCEKIIDEINQSSWVQHVFYNALTKELFNKSGEKELEVCYEKIELRELLTKKVHEAINLYVTKDYKTDCFGGWQEFSWIRFNRYKKGQTMAKHVDHIHDMFDGKHKGIPVLSIVGLLNDNYEGGQFVMFDDMKIELKQGDIMIFPSCFLYPHVVKDVTKGTRYSFVSWVW